MFDCSWAEAFFFSNHHQVWVILDKYYSPSLVQEEVVADGGELELRLQGLSKFPKVSFECK